MSLRKAKASSSRYNSSPCSSTESISSSSNPKPNTNTILNVKPITNTNNFTSMVKKFMENRSTSKTKSKLIIPADFIADDLKKRPKIKASSFPTKLFGVGDSNGNGDKKKALTEVKPNTRTLAMVLRSERELLTQNKDQQLLISQLQSQLLERNLQVEKLKDLCLKQREEIKALKTAVLFPEEMNLQLHDILEKQQAPQLIPNLQSQISTLTAQLHSLSHDIAKVKEVKYTDTPSFEPNFSSPRTPTPIYHQHEPSNSLDFSDEDTTTPDSPDDMLLKDVNPCLTPCYSKTKSKEYDAMLPDYTPTKKENHSFVTTRDSRKMSASSEHLKNLRPGGGSSSSTACASFRRSDESKYRYGKPMDHQ